MRSSPSVRGTVRRRLLAATGAALVVVPTIAACGSEDGTQINVYYAPEQNFQAVIDRCNEEANGEYEIVYRKLPREADGQREQMVRRLAAGDTDLDILGLDVTWVPEFAEAEWLEEWTGENKAAAEDGVLQGPLETAQWNDRLYAATKNTNVQLLWFDKTVTPQPPETWREMIETAKELKAEGQPYEIVFTGAQYEGLVVTYNTLVASAGGHIMSDDGKSVVMDEGAVEALELLQEVASSGLTNPSLTNAKEQQVEQAFSTAGSKAAFELNWPYVYSAMRDAASPRFEDLGWARYPGIDGPSRVTIGGYNLAVSKYSQHKPEAFEAALCLRNEESQRYSALNDGVPPTLEAIYDGSDTEFTETYPMWETIQEELQDPAIRPLTVVYQNLSTITAKVLSPPADIDPQATAEELREGLQEALESKGVLP